MRSCSATSDMLGRLAGEEIELVVSPQADPAWVLVDPGHVEQVLVNLAVNASDAMRSGGTLTLATRKAELTEEAAAEFQASPGSYVVLSVGDDGEGMDEEMKEKIFEPFFTTKGGGSGLDCRPSTGSYVRARVSSASRASRGMARSSRSGSPAPALRRRMKVRRKDPTEGRSGRAPSCWPRTRSS